MNTPPTSHQAEPLTLGDILDDCGCERKQIAHAARVSLGMVDAWISGTKTVSHVRLRLMLTRGPQALVDAVAGWMLRGTNRRMVPADSAAAAEHDRLLATASLMTETADVVAALATGASAAVLNKEADEAYRALENARNAGMAPPLLKIA